MPRRHRPPLADADALDPESEPAEPHTIRRRTPLPNARAIAGGFLVAVALLGVSGAHLQAGATATTAFVVAREDLAPGAVVEPAHLELRHLVLPSEMANSTFRQITEVQGAVVLGPVGAGELVQAAAVRAEPPDRAGDRRELSLSVERARAVDGRLQPGDTVDLLATYGTGEQAYTQVVAQTALVRSVQSDDTGGFGGSGQVTIALALTGSHELLASAHAAHADAITVVRSTGATDDRAAEVYRPPGPRASDVEASGSLALRAQS